MSFYLVGCSKNIESLPLNEQAIYLPARFSIDSSKDLQRMPLEILNFISISPSMKIVDILGGGGYYSKLFNHIVGKEGNVHLQNNSLFLGFNNNELSLRLKNNRLANVNRLDSEYTDLKLPSDIDIMFFLLEFS